MHDFYLEKECFLVLIFFGFVVHAFDFKIPHLRTRIAGSQIGDKYVSTEGLEAGMPAIRETRIRFCWPIPLTRAKLTSCHNSVGRKLNWNWPQLAFPNSRESTPPWNSWQHYQTHTAVTFWPSSESAGKKVLSKQGTNLPGCMQRKRKSKAINSPWGNMLRLWIRQVVQTVSCIPREDAPSFPCPPGPFRLHCGGWGWGAMGDVEWVVGKFRTKMDNVNQDILWTSLLNGVDLNYIWVTCIKVPGEDLTPGSSRWSSEWFSNCGPATSRSASPGNLSEMQIPGS